MSLPIGIISEGTFRAQDIIPKLMDMVKDHCPTEYVQLVVNNPIPAYAQEDEDAEWWRGEEATSLLKELAELLKEECAPFTYLGLHVKDDSCIGVFIDWEGVENAIFEGILSPVDDPSNLNRLPKDIEYATTYSDDGNVTLYQRDDDGVWQIVWEVVWRIGKRLSVWYWQPSRS